MCIRDRNGQAGITATSNGDVITVQDDNSPISVVVSITSAAPTGTAEITGTPDDPGTVKWDEVTFSFDEIRKGETWTITLDGDTPFIYKTLSATDDVAGQMQTLINNGSVYNATATNDDRLTVVRANDNTPFFASVDLTPAGNISDAVDPAVANLSLIHI